MKQYIEEIRHILEQARQKAYSAVNTVMVQAYWLTGKRIVEEEQSGRERAAYGKEVIKNLSAELTRAFGKGFSERSLREFRQFHLLFPDLLLSEIPGDDKWQNPFAVSVNPIWRTPFAKLHWSHYQRVLKIADEKARAYYIREAASENWSISTLERNINTLYYQRLLSSKEIKPVENEMLA